MKVKKNDTVVMISGKNKGKKGKVLKVHPKQNSVVVEKVNVVKKHVRKRQTAAGEIITFEAALPISTVMVVCPHCDKKTRVAYAFSKDGRKERVCKHCQEHLDTTLSAS
jgi:large subunit ribosomal protein L24